MFSVQTWEASDQVLALWGEGSRLGAPLFQALGCLAWHSEPEGVPTPRTGRGGGEGGTAVAR